MFFLFTNRSKKIGYNSQDQRSSFVTIYPHVVKGHPQITSVGSSTISHRHIHMYICIYNCYVLIFHSVVPDVSAISPTRTAAWCYI